MKKSAGLGYGPVQHAHLRSKEIAWVRKHDHKAYMLWLHLQASTYAHVDVWQRSMAAMARDFGAGESSLRRWAVTLEKKGLIKRQVKYGEREEQRWQLLVPPSVRASQAPLADAEGAAKAQDLRERIESLEGTLRKFYSGLDLPPAMAALRDEARADLDAMRVELELLM